MRILTGDRPSGKLHLGHYVGSLKNRIYYQDNFEQFIIIADLQALTDDPNRGSVLKENIRSIVCDYLSVGIDPRKSIIFLQSKISALSELTMYFMNLVSISRLQRNPTVKTEIKSKNMNKSIPVGFFVYPISQAADILAFDATHVPAGKDQLPMIEQTNEIAVDFNRAYNFDFFKKVEAIVPKKGGRLSGIDGKAKMSKSLNNAIYLCDGDDEIKKKVFSMYTDANHLKISDPGKVEGNIVFEYLDIFDENKKEINDLKDHYQKGGLGDVILKKRLTDVLVNLITPIRKRRFEFEKNFDFLDKIIISGTEKASDVASKTLKSVKEIMQISYF
jgi:tryptophanyl-tRNA synthetase